MPGRMPLRGEAPDRIPQYPHSPSHIGSPQLDGSPQRRREAEGRAFAQSARQAITIGSEAPPEAAAGAAEPSRMMQSETDSPSHVPRGALRAAGAAVRAGQATWRALVPLDHSTLLPTAMRALQQGHTEANWARMVMVLVVSSVYRRAGANKWLGAGSNVSSAGSLGAASPGGHLGPRTGPREAPRPRSLAGPAKIGHSARMAPTNILATLGALWALCTVLGHALPGRAGQFFLALGLDVRAVLDAAKPPGGTP